MVACLYPRCDYNGGVEGMCSDTAANSDHLNPWSTGVFNYIALSLRSGARCDACLRYDPAIVPSPANICISLTKDREDYSILE